MNAQPSRWPEWAREVFAEALRLCDGNVSELARRVGVPRTTIVGWQRAHTEPTLSNITPLIEMVRNASGDPVVASPRAAREARALREIACALERCGTIKPASLVSRPGECTADCA